MFELNVFIRIVCFPNCLVSQDKGIKPFVWCKVNRGVQEVKTRRDSCDDTHEAAPVSEVFCQQTILREP